MRSHRPQWVSVIASSPTSSFTAPRWHRSSRPAVLVVLALLTGAVTKADFSKTITATLDVPVNAATTWYYSSCATSLGLGSYSINLAPMHGTVLFQTIDGPVPGCPSGSPSLPAAEALYTLTDSTASSDYFQLYFEISGQVAEVLDITVNPSTGGGGGSPPPPPQCTITSKTLVSVLGTNNSRQKIGVGEFVSLSNGGGIATWTIESGNALLGQVTSDSGGNPSCSAEQAGTTASGSSVCLIAPYLNDTSQVISKLNSGGGSCSIGFQTVEPQNVEFYKLNTHPKFGLTTNSVPFSDNVSYDERLWSAVFITPGDVSFNNINIFENDNLHPEPQLILHTDPSPSLIGPDNSIPAWFTTCDYEEQAESTSDGMPHVSDSPWSFKDLQGGHEKEFSIVRTIWSVGLIDPGDFSVAIDAPRSDIVYAKGQIQSLNPTGTTFISSPGIATEFIKPRSVGIIDSLRNEIAWLKMEGYFNRHSCLGTAEKQFVFLKELQPSATQASVKQDVGNAVNIEGAVVSK